MFFPFERLLRSQNKIINLKNSRNFINLMKLKVSCSYIQMFLFTVLFCTVTLKCNSFTCFRKLTFFDFFFSKNICFLRSMFFFFFSCKVLSPLNASLMFVLGILHHFSFRYLNLNLYSRFYENWKANKLLITKNMNVFLFFFSLTNCYRRLHKQVQAFEFVFVVADYT